MPRYFCYLAVTLFVCGIFSLNSVQTAYGQKSKQRSFYIESQPDSPLLIRDLTATILPKNKYRNEPEIEVVFYVENISKKKVKWFGCGARAADGSDERKADERKDDERVNFGLSVEDFLPGVLNQGKFTTSLKGASLIFRIGDVTFDDYTSWKAKPFKAANAKKSAPIVAVKQKFNDATSSKRILTREWTVPVFNDRVTRTFDGRSQVIDGITVQTKIHEIETEYLDDVDYCAVEIKEIEVPNGEMIYTDQDERVEKFTTYEINGRVFAYSIPYESFEADTRKEVGVGFRNFYVDEDGSGVFKLQCSDDREITSLPQWVKALAGK